jgi:hypothetical protein
VSTGELPERLPAAERRLGEHLVLLRDVPDAPASLTKRVVRAAHWQRVVREPLLAVGHVAAAVGDALRVLLGGGRR